MQRTTGTGIALFLLLSTVLTGHADTQQSGVENSSGTAISDTTATADIGIIKRGGLTPGEAVMVEVIPGEETIEVTGEVCDKKIPFWEEDAGRFRAIIGFDRDVETGTHDLHLTVHTKDGTVGELTEEIEVEEKEFRVVKLRVPSKPGGLTDADYRRIKFEKILIDSILSIQTNKKLWERSFVPPLERMTVTEDFGTGRIINGRKRNPHGGLDLRAKSGTPVKASNDGIVALCGRYFYTGNSVFIDHGLGVYSMYFHFNEILVRQGERVKRGQVIGTVGSTGRSTGPHLHWAFQINRARIDPLSIITLPMDGTH